jgi:hypothetical protein
VGAALWCGYGNACATLSAMRTDDAARPFVPPAGGEPVPLPSDGTAPLPSEAAVAVEPRESWYDGIVPSFRAAFSLRDVRSAARVALVIALLGVPLGLLWAVVSPHAPVVITRDGAVLADYRQEVFVGADGTFALIGLLTGVVVGAAVYLWRRARGPWMALGVALGSLAGGYVAWKTGHQVGLDEFRRLVEEGRNGQRFVRPVDLRAKGVLFVQPLVAVIVYVLAAGWSRFDDLGRVDAGDGGPSFSSHSAVPAAPQAGPVPPPAGGASSPPA